MSMLIYKLLYTFFSVTSYSNLSMEESRAGRLNSTGHTPVSSQLNDDNGGNVGNDQSDAIDSLSEADMDAVGFILGDEMPVNSMDRGPRVDQDSNDKRDSSH